MEDMNLIEPILQAEIKLRPDNSYIECVMRATVHAEVLEIDWRIGEDLSILDTLGGGGGGEAS
jgi:hypothetical protein